MKGRGEKGHQARPTAIDLFAGAGGLSLGFEQAGFDVLTSVEYDPVHAAVHAYNFPHTSTICGDVAKISSREIVEKAREGWERFGRSGEFDGVPDVVFGGPPCQGFSTIGKRLIEDERNNLVFHFFRVVTDLRARYFVMENVPGMRAGGHAGILGRLIAEFEAAGYHITMPPRVLNAADYGVPQDRRRLFLLGSRKDQRPIQYPNPTTLPVLKRAERRRSTGPTLFADDKEVQAGPTVWDAIGDLPDLDNYATLCDSDEIRLSEAETGRFERRASEYALRLRDADVDPSDFSYRRRWDHRLLTSAMRTQHTSLSIRRFDATAPGDTESVSRFYRLPKHGLCNTLRAGTGSEHGAHTSPRPIHPIYPRVISVREAARLHSFPDWFRLHQTKWHGFRQVGNAVPPLLGRAVAAQVARALDFRPLRPRRSIDMGDPELLAYTMTTASEYFGARKEDVPRQRRRLVAGGAA